MSVFLWQLKQKSVQAFGVLDFEFSIFAVSPNQIQIQA